MVPERATSTMVPCRTTAYITPTQAAIVMM
jgi:hypothetical protein